MVKKFSVDSFHKAINIVLTLSVIFGVVSVVSLNIFCLFTSILLWLLSVLILFSIDFFNLK